MSISSSQVKVSREIPRQVVATITGDGSTTLFTIIHNLNNDMISFLARDVQDSLRYVILENYPDGSDPMNKLIVEFDIPPTALQSYRILLQG